jgi:hypothetical protein
MRNTDPVTRAATEKNRQAVCRQHRTDLTLPERDYGVAFYFMGGTAAMANNHVAMNLVQPLGR